MSSAVLARFARAATHAAAQLLLGEERKPPLHQVEPGRARRREVELEARALREPTPDQRRLVRPVVVENEVHREVGRDVGSCRGTGGTRRCGGAGDIHRRPYRSSRRGPRTATSCHGVDSRGCVARSVRGASGAGAGCDRAPGSAPSRPRTVRAPCPAGQVQPRDVTHLVDEQRGLGEFTRLRAVWLQREGPPDAADRGLTQARFRGHRSRTPVRGVPGCRLEGLRHHRLDLRVPNTPWGSGARLIKEPVQATRDEPGPPLADHLLRDAKACGH